MRRKVMPLDFIVYMLILTGITMCIIDSTFKFVSFDYNRRIVLLITIASLVYMYLICLFKYAWLSILLIFLLPKPLYTIKYLYVFALRIRGFVESITANQYITESYSGYFVNLVYIVLPIFIAMIYYIAVSRRHAITLIVFGSTIFITYYFMDVDKIFFTCNLFIILCLGLYAFNEHVKNRIKWETVKVKVKPNYIIRKFVLVLIFLFITNVTVKILPYNAKPASFDWLEQNVFNNFDGFGDKEGSGTLKSVLKNRFNFSYTGFQQNQSRLGGPVKLSNAIAMKIYTSSTAEELHLRGTIKDYYDGSKWKKTDTSTAKYTDFFDIGSIKARYTDKSIVIYPVRTVTTTAFNVLYPYSVQNKWGYVYVDSDAEIYNPKNVKQGQKYTISYREYEINEKFLLDNAKYPEYYGKEMQKYLQIPSSMPDRVFKLTREITDKFVSPYEKASAIENYLKQNYPYTRDAAYPSDGKDFVDYFLFQEKKGYCTYYASAMAVMCRIANIPSRYVEGFDISSPGGVSGYTNVLNSNAHAWVELYFDGAGWMTFDPTPGHTSMAQVISSIKETNNSNFENNQNTAQLEQNMNDNSNKRNQRDIENGTAESTGSKSSKSNVPAILLMLLFLGTVIFYIKENYCYTKKKNFIFKMTEDIMHYGRYIGITYSQGETVREYFHRLGENLDIDLSSYIEIYEKTLYGGYKFGEKDNNKLNAIVKSIRQKVIKRKGIVRFYFTDYINMYPMPKINRFFKKYKVIMRSIVYMLHLKDYLGIDKF